MNNFEFLHGSCFLIQDDWNLFFCLFKTHWEGKLADHAAGKLLNWNFQESITDPICLLAQELDASVAIEIERN